jgi:uncharacterized protein YjbI with pentapeptide repeats
MAEQDATKKPDWPTCGKGGCIGVRVDGQKDCLAHVGSQIREAILAAFKPFADVDLRGTPIDPELLSQLLAGLRPEDGSPTLGNAKFDRAQFTGDAEFAGAQFTGDAKFAGAQFSGHAGFRWVQFSGAAGFRAAQFSGHAGFDRAQFSGAAGFREVQFSGTSGFAAVVEARGCGASAPAQHS